MKPKKCKLEAMTNVQKELAKGELARLHCERLEMERRELRENLEEARERAERTLFRKGTRAVCT
jgi:hypothetical protein